MRMLSFYDQIDIEKTIKRAKMVLSEYSRLLKILNHALYDLVPSAARTDILSFSSYVNSDLRLLEAIERKDRSYEELRRYIQKIQSSINCLDLEEIELIKLKYVDGYTASMIAEKQKISSRRIYKLLKQSYVDFAIAYGVHVMKKTTKGMGSIDVPESGTKT